jgi:hypothetical protein
MKTCRAFFPLTAAVATLCAAVTQPSRAAESYEPYLDCAASRAHYAVLLRDAKYDDAVDLKKVEDSVHAYLRIAISLAGRELHDEFRTAANKVQAAEEAVMKKDGANGYLAASEQTATACAARVDAHKDELLKAMNQYEAHQQFGGGETQKPVK